MRDFPTDPMAQHSLFMAALCGDMRDLCAGRGTPRSDRIAEIARQTNEIDECGGAFRTCARPGEAGSSNLPDKFNREPGLAQQAAPESPQRRKA